MMRAVLDTSVVIARDVPELDGELAISAATIAELHFGVLFTTTRKRGPNASCGSLSVSTGSGLYLSPTPWRRSPMVAVPTS